MTKGPMVMAAPGVVAVVMLGGCANERSAPQIPVAKPIFRGPDEGRRVGNPPDDVLVFMLGGGESGSTFELSVANAKPNAGPPEHVHEDVDEAFYVVSGSFRAKVGDQIAEGGPGYFVFAPHGLPHAWLNSGPTDGTLLTISSPPKFEPLMRDISEALRRTPPSSPDQIEKVLAPITHKYKVRIVGPPLSSSAQQTEPRKP